MKAIITRLNKELNLSEDIINILYSNFRYDNNLILVNNYEKLKNVMHMSLPNISSEELQYIYKVCNTELIKVT